jgi:hypothetical protein
MAGHTIFSLEKSGPLAQAQMASQLGKSPSGTPFDMMIFLFNQERLL